MAETPVLTEAKTPRRRWMEMSTKRVTSALNALRLVGNMGNRSSYEYRESEVEAVFHELETALAEAREKFAEKKTGARTFSMNFEED